MLDQEDDDGRSGIDHQLPGVRIAEQRPAQGSYHNNAAGHGERNGCAQHAGCLPGDISENERPYSIAAGMRAEDIKGTRHLIEQLIRVLLLGQRRLKQTDQGRHLQLLREKFLAVV